MKISVILPVLNEAVCLPKTLEHLRRAEDLEILVVDGGSRDGTADLARRHTPLVFEASPGRGAQMNLGARHASGEVLLFLHADSRLEASGFEALRSAMQDPAVAGGAFRLRIDPPGPVLNLIAAGANFRSVWLRLPFGDQGIFARASAFHRVGGYPEIPLMEDVSFIRKLRHAGDLVTLSCAVATSSRRWREEGLFFATLRNWSLLLLFLAGVPPRWFPRWYRPVR